MPNANTSAAASGMTSAGGNASATPVPSRSRTTTSAPIEIPNRTMNWDRIPNSATTTASRLRANASRIERWIASNAPTSPRTMPAGTYTNGAPTSVPTMSDSP